MDGMFEFGARIMAGWLWADFGVWKRQNHLGELKINFINFTVLTLKMF